MENTKKSETDAESSLPESRPEAAIAPLPARILAAFVDYLVVAAAGNALSGIIPGSDYDFFIALAVGAVYFSVGHSAALDGRTLGKRSFGIQVRTLDAATGILGGPPSLGRSALRYLTAYGILILVAELPALYYRSIGLVAAPTLLEAHMLLVMSYFFLDVCLAVAHRQRRSLHDLISGTVVISLAAGTTDQAYIKPGSPGLRGGFALPLAFLSLAFLLWGQGFVRAGAAPIVHRYRYQIEKRYPLRILSVVQQGEVLEIGALVLQPQTVSDQALPAAELARNVLQMLKDAAPAFEESARYVVFQQVNAIGADGEPAAAAIKIDIRTLALVQ